MELWHALNRGVDGRNLFLDSSDYVRFIHNLFEFNDTAPAHQFSRRPANVGSRKPNIVGARDRLVEIHGWTLMKNHYHLVLSELVENGVSLFLRKLNTGYANYFNARHARLGTLFAGRTKRVLIERHEHFLYILHYVHLNPLDYVTGFEGWRERSKGLVPNIHTALSHLNDYRWSSYLDYAGVKNFPSLLTKTRFESTPGEYIADLRDYLKDISDPTLPSSLLLE